MMQQQVTTEPGRLIIPSDLEIRILDSGIPDSDISNCVAAHNAEWKRFFVLTPRLMRQRLNSGELFLGGYKQGSLVTYLETQSHYMEIPDMPANPDQPDIETARRIANFVSVQLRGNYFVHAPGGEWPARPENANVIRFVSINTPPKERDFGYAGQIMDYIKRLMRQPRKERPEQLRSAAVGLTDTPVKNLPQKFHTEYLAQITEHREVGFRPGYDEPDIIRFFYFTPGFKAPLGRIRLK